MTQQLQGDTGARPTILHAGTKPTPTQKAMYVELHGQHATAHESPGVASHPILLLGLAGACGAARTLLDIHVLAY